MTVDGVIFINGINIIYGYHLIQYNTGYIARIRYLTKETLNSNKISPHIA